MQDPGAEGLLLQNAINAGYSPDTIEEREVDYVAYLSAKAEDPVEIANAQAADDEQSKLDRIRAAVLEKFPSRQSVAAAIDAVPNTVAGCKAAMKAGFDVLYLLATNKET
jgi:hypothetical protein